MENIFETIDLDLVLFDPQPIWLPLFDTTNSPAIHLTPLDWTQYEFARRVCSVPGTQVVNPRTLLRQLLVLTKADKWRGFQRNGQDIPFDQDTCWQALCSNTTLGLTFDRRLAKIAEGGKVAIEAARKNSDAGDGMPSAVPKAKKKSGQPSASNA